MTKLSDTQSIILSSAAQRADVRLYPLPTTLRPGGGTAKALAALMRAGYAEEREANDVAARHREDGDLCYGLFATAAGLAAIGITPTDDGGEGAATAPVTEAASTPASAPSQGTKTAAVIALLRRETGATIAELIAATGWLPHTTRAALTGLRKEGHTIEKSKRDGATCYRIAPTTVPASPVAAVPA